MPRKWAAVEFGEVAQISGSFLVKMEDQVEKIEEERARASSGPFRHYVFDTSELLSETTRFLQQVGYELETPRYLGFVQPDFMAKRQEGERIYKIVGLVREDIDRAVEGLIQLSAIRAIRDDLDCVLVCPPINEYLLIDFLNAETGRWYFAMKDANLLFWLCNPEDQTTWSLIGYPSDDLFQQHFILTKVAGTGGSFDQMIGMQLYRQRMLQEEEEDEF